MSLLELYQKHCLYEINDNVQSLDFDIDIEHLRQELFNFIITNNFGFSTVSLRLPKDSSDYTSRSESLKSGAMNPYGIFDEKNLPSNTIHNKEYTVWHPDLIDSYTASLVPEIERFSGLHIGRIRLGWLQSNSGYEIHSDLEPMRFHIPLFTNNLSYILHDHKLFHMQYGKLHHLITTSIHTAWNFGSLPRLHLIFSTYADSDVDTEIEKLTALDLGKKNLTAQLDQQGIDKYSLEKLLLISNNQSTINADEKRINLGKIKQIIDLVTKN